MRIAGAVGAVAVLAVVAGGLAGVVESRPAVVRGVAVDVPPIGTVVAVEAPGRTPAFVASTPDGVRAFLGFAPHSGLPLAWCPASSMFAEPVGASLFDIAGDYLFGPSPGGLWPLEVTMVDGRAVVGDEVGVPSPRLIVPRWMARLVEELPLGQEWVRGTSPAGLGGRRAPDPCLDSEGSIGGLWAPVSVVPGPVPLAEATRDPGWSLVAASLEDGDLVDRDGHRVAVVDRWASSAWQAELEVLVRRRGTVVEAIPTFRPGFVDERWCGRGTVQAVSSTADISGSLALSLTLDRLEPAQGCGYGTFSAPPPGITTVDLTLFAGTMASLLTDPSAYVLEGPDGPAGTTYPLDPIGLPVLVRGGPGEEVTGVYAPLPG